MRLRRGLLLLTAAAVVAATALSPPFDRLADRSFAWHMLQHMLLLYPVALLLLAARPFDIFAAVAGKRGAAVTVRAMRRFEAAAAPWITLAFFTAVLWVTHFSSLYERSLENGWMHVGEHALYLLAGMAFWLPVVAPPPIRPLNYPARLLYLMVALPQGALLGLALFAATTPLYAHYLSLAPSAALALDDQRNAAALMWIAGGLAVLLAMLFTLGAWARRESFAAR
ncbi:MAG TPA: cytochrome c oxidase assembly protein [Candidatus Baltobacteraceae bacterium]|nr:cytochrome c oxidase assembly protein [Candidatus Baltobacteraceae bacterium]